MHKLLLFGISLAMGWLEFDLVFFTMGAWIFQLLLLFSFYSSFVTSTGSVSQVSFKQDSSTSSLKKAFWCQTAWKINFHSNSFNGKNPLAAVCELCLQKIKCKKGSSIIKSELRRSRRQFMVSLIFPKNKRKSNNTVKDLTNGQHTKTRQHHNST